MANVFFLRVRVEGKNARLSSFLLQLSFCVWKFCGRRECPADFKVLANLRSLSLSISNSTLLFFLFVAIEKIQHTARIHQQIKVAFYKNGKRLVVGVATIALKENIMERSDSFICL